MNRASKILLIISSIALIFFDATVFFDITQAKGGKQVFDLVLSNMLPCKAMLGITGLLYAFEKPQKKVFAVFTAIFSGLMVVIHLFALIVQIIDFVNGIAARTTDEYLGIASFVGEIIVLIAVIFLMVYVVNKKMKRTSLIVSGVAFSVLLITWVIGFYRVIAAFTGDFSDFISELFSGNIDATTLICLVSYVLIFSGITNVFEGTLKINKEKA